MAKAFRVDLRLTTFDAASPGLPAERPWRSGIACPQDPPIVHLAVAACASCEPTPLDLAFLPHISKVRGGTDRFSGELVGQHVWVRSWKLADEALADVRLRTVGRSAPTEQWDRRGTVCRRGEGHAGPKR